MTHVLVVHAQNKCSERTGMNGGFVGPKQRMLLSCKWLSGLYNAEEKSTLKISQCSTTEMKSDETHCSARSLETILMDKYLLIKACLVRFVSLFHLSFICLPFSIFLFEIFISFVFISHLRSSSVTLFWVFAENKTALLMEELSTVYFACTERVEINVQSQYEHMSQPSTSHFMLSVEKYQSTLCHHGGFPCCFMAKPRGGRRGEGGEGSTETRRLCCVCAWGVSLFVIMWSWMSLQQFRLGNLPLQ